MVANSRPSRTRRKNTFELSEKGKKGYDKADADKMPMRGPNPKSVGRVVDPGLAMKVQKARKINKYKVKV